MAKKFAIWFVANMNDAMFNPPPEQKSQFAAFVELKEELNRRNVECHTYDIYERENRIPDIVLFHDIPRVPLSKILGDSVDKIKKHVILMESSMIIPRNWDLNRHKEFDKIFTWDSNICDGKKYFLTYYSFDLTTPVCTAVDRPRLCIIIAGNKRSALAGELYSKRIEIIRWFAKNHPDDLDFFGHGWEMYTFWHPRWTRHLNRLNFLHPLRRAMAEKFPTYKGSISDKNRIMQKYKFSICYENTSDKTGYVTEKIFDCFFSGCIPIYLGAKNIDELIPEDCFLDARKFLSFEDMYRRISEMSDEERAGYIRHIEAFLKSEDAKKFSARAFARNIADAIL